ncbi:MAG: MarR family transcriptional regulator [Pseudomonadota bacterium]
MAGPLPLDTSVFFKLVRVVNLTARPFLETVGKQHHLSLNEWRVMVVLASHPGVAATDVAESTGLDKMSVSRALGALERRGRLLREADPDDQRRSRLTLSKEGKRLFAKIGVAAKKREAELFSGVRTAELEQLGRTLDKLIGAVREQG